MESHDLVSQALVPLLALQALGSHIAVGRGGEEGSAKRGLAAVATGAAQGGGARHCGLPVPFGTPHSRPPHSRTTRRISFTSEARAGMIKWVGMTGCMVSTPSVAPPGPNSTSDVQVSGSKPHEAIACGCQCRAVCGVAGHRDVTWVSRSATAQAATARRCGNFGQSELFSIILCRYISHL